MEIVLIVGQTVVVTTPEAHARGELDRDPVESLNVEGGAVARLSESAAHQLARKLLNTLGVNVVWPTTPQRGEE